MRVKWEHVLGAALCVLVASVAWGQCSMCSCLEPHEITDCVPTGDGVEWYRAQAVPSTYSGTCLNGSPSFQLEDGNEDRDKINNSAGPCQVICGSSVWSTGGGTGFDWYDIDLHWCVVS